MSTVRPYLQLRASSRVPVVLTCEHARSTLPAGLPTDRASRAILRTHWGFDIGAWQLTRALSRRLGTSAIGGRYSRLYIDLNRRIDDPSLIRREVEGVTLPWNARLDGKETIRRHDALHLPYHRAIERSIASRLAFGVRPLVFAIHSFTDLYAGRRRTFDIGVLYDRDVGFARELMETLGHAGLVVRGNQPYSGRRGLMYSADRHGTHHSLPCLELEVRQDRFADPRFHERLARLLVPVLRRLAGRIPATADRLARGPSG